MESRLEFIASVDEIFTRQKHCSRNILLNSSLPSIPEGMMWGGNYDAERFAGASTNRTAAILSGSDQPRASSSCQGCLLPGQCAERLSHHPLHAAITRVTPTSLLTAFGSRRRRQVSGTYLGRLILHRSPAIGPTSAAHESEGRN
ncbi:BZ3500_MvSof-1268-A1-R1_Chr11-2g03371 [Microbotryum saponariae]|uniref:BZ3500_MvSof-1268-A1-R1_Chr11-2g03371 protein n=1 Tax=Microbotryum saponariae TaxID=289078 RepID=A0A2X0L8N4_9BASI|nr:BZ3500_MvSof-1268-A1-R1_Chr11-2g03371 [Microbotryum saponariae]SDA03220.1 BZ3501_MvSof-1269-A2-R1_Chr11g02942 [Microbotryum saponariae]